MTPREALLRRKLFGMKLSEPIEMERPMMASEIRAKYWKACNVLRDPKNTENDAERDRMVQLLQAEMLCELAAQQAITNDLLKSKLGPVNVEKLALEIGKLIEELG